MSADPAGEAGEAAEQHGEEDSGQGIGKKVVAGRNDDQGGQHGVGEAEAPHAPVAGVPEEEPPRPQRPSDVE